MVTVWKVRTAAEEQSLEERTATLLRDLIGSGGVVPGEQLMSEPDLARTLGVSRPTLRVAISILVADRLLVRRRGIGTFVATSAPSLSNGFERLRGTAELIAMNGQTPGVTGLKVNHEAASVRIANHLGIAARERVVRISRTFTANGLAVMFAQEWIPESILSQASLLDEFNTGDSLYQRLTQLGLSIDRAVAKFVPTNADTKLAERLGISIGDPILLLEQQHFADAVPERVVMFSDNYNNPQSMDTHILRRG